MSTKRAVQALTLSCLLTSTALAENLRLKPGLWQITSTREGSGAPAIPAEKQAQMKQAMEKMPPEQRARMEAAMRGAGGAPTVTQSCVLADDLKKPMTFGGDQPSCKRTMLTSTGSTQEVQVDCETNGRTSTSVFKITAADMEHWNATLDINMNLPQGGSVMKTRMAGKWMSSDCGSVKPASQK